MSMDEISKEGLGPRKVQGTKVKRPARTMGVQGYVPELVKGLGQTMGYALRNTKDMVLGTRNDPVLESIDDGINTISYPEQKKPYADRFRGVHRLTQREDGTPRCVACMCCSTACPAFNTPGTAATDKTESEVFLKNALLLFFFIGES